MKMRTLIIPLTFLVCAASAVAGDSRFNPRPASPRIIHIGTEPKIQLVSKGKSTFEIVEHTNTQAAKELTDKLVKITGYSPKLVKTASGDIPAFHLGVSEETLVLGLDPAKIDLDGYFIRTKGLNIFIVGCDENGQHGTLNGVYEFLERFADVRYYFPGEIGTIIPTKTEWVLPDIDITDRPDNQARYVYSTPIPRLGSVEQFTYPGVDMKQLNETSQTGRGSHLFYTCHGLNRLELAKRFAKSHPEYFALTNTGARFTGADRGEHDYNSMGHLCYHSAVKEVIYQDCVACLTGKTAASRGISKWTRLHQPPFVDIMPNDGMVWCLCPKCLAIQARGTQAKSDFIWEFFTGIAKRLKDENIPGYVNTSAYADCRMVPTCDIPDNVIVQLCIGGPWNETTPAQRVNDDQLISDWYRKLNAKPYLWVYPTKSCAAIPDIPNFTPRAVAQFFRRHPQDIFGAFFEAETDRWLFGFLNIYVFYKQMWDVNTDFNALLDEHCRLMYGPAAQQMSQFYDNLENL